MKNTIYITELNTIAFIHSKWKENKETVYKTCEGIRYESEFLKITNEAQLNRLIMMGAEIAPSTLKLIKEHS